MKLSEKEIEERVKMLSGLFNRSRYGITFSSLESVLQYTENLINHICKENNSLKCCGNCKHSYPDSLEELSCGIDGNCVQKEHLCKLWTKFDRR